MYVKVRVQTHSKKETFEILEENRFNICVKEKSTQNLANRRVTELVAHHYKVPIKTVRIVSGHHAPSKIFSVG